MGIKIPFHINFEEVNLRFYVRYNDSGVWKRGAVFIKEIVPKWAISLVANTIYREKYSTKKMKHFFNASANEIKAGYQWKHENKWNSIEVTTAPNPLPMLPGSEEEFIAEHYWGYSRYDALTTFEYAVQHRAWRVYQVKDHLINCDFGSLYGPGFAFLQQSSPASVFMAEGSAIAVLQKRKL
jgi:uncharacterized protein YqjF (DUF2071 family)